MRKSENTPAVASRPATKPSKRDAADAMRSATEYLIATRQAERALKAGNCASTFRLRDNRGVEVASETLLSHRPLLLTFYTGSWCPACSRDLQAFESLRPSIEARGASEHLAADDHRERRSPRAIEAGISDPLGPRRPACPAVRRALAHSRAPPRHPQEERHRPATPQRRSGLDATDPGPLHPRSGRRHRLLRDQPRPVRPLPAARRSACAGPPAQPACRLNREQQSAGERRPAFAASEGQAWRVATQRVSTCDLAHRWARLRPQFRTTAPKRLRDD
jgi:hypothetical protein